MGESHNAEGPASSVLAFLITGALSNLREMAALFPVSNVSAEFMYQKATNIIKDLEEIGFIVPAIINDNHRKNQCLYSIFCRNADLESASVSVPHPCNPDRRLWLINDPSHILKCWRNNFHNAKELVYPNIWEYFNVDFSPKLDRGSKVKSCTAKWSVLEHSYDLEKTSSLRYTVLSSKAVRPNSLEKQDVNLALKIFNNKTTSGKGSGSFI